MTKEAILSSREDRKVSTLFTDIKSLFKSFVLIANVLPVFVGFWLALYFTESSIMAHLDVLLLTIFGSTTLIAGALVLNNWYDVDIDTVMERTKQRPTVTGNFSLRGVLILGIALSAIGMVILFFTTFEAAVYAFIGWFLYVVPYTMWSKRKYTMNTVIGSLSGSFFIGTLSSTLNLNNISPYIQWIIKGLMLILALALDLWQKGNHSK